MISGRPPVPFHKLVAAAFFQCSWGYFLSLIAAAAVSMLFAKLIFPDENWLGQWVAFIITFFCLALAAGCYWALRHRRERRARQGERS